MLEYFTYKKFKKNKAEKEEKARAESQEAEDRASKADGKKPAKRPERERTRTFNGDHSPAPVLDAADERFFRSILADPDDRRDSDDEGPKPPLPPRIKTPELTWTYSNDSRLSNERAARADAGPSRTKTLEPKDEEGAKKKSNRLSILFNRKDKKDQQLAPPRSDGVSRSEAEREKHDMGKVLDDLNLSAKNNKAFSLNTESSKVVREFTTVLRDLINGVPTAADDLVALVQDRDGVISRNFDKLPSSLKKLVTQLPDKVTGSLAPELLAAAAASQGIKVDEKRGAKGAAKNMLKPNTLMDLVTKPGAIVGMLRAIVNALKLRWPAFVGANVLWSVAVFLLMFVLWYCHKRGREVRLEQERLAAEGEPIDGSSRIVELPDDPQLPSPGGSRGGGSRSSHRRPEIVDPPRSSDRGSPRGDLPRPPIGGHASPPRSPRRRRSSSSQDRRREDRERERDRERDRDRDRDRHSDRHSDRHRDRDRERERERERDGDRDSRHRRS